MLRSGGADWWLCVGNRYIAQLSRALNIPESAQKAAGQVFKLAVGLNFIQGRRTKTVAAVALYIACRRQQGNTVMLIDFSDVLTVCHSLRCCAARLLIHL